MGEKLCLQARGGKAALHGIGAVSAGKEREGCLIWDRSCFCRQGEGRLPYMGEDRFLPERLLLLFGVLELG